MKNTTIKRYMVMAILPIVLLPAIFGAFLLLETLPQKKDAPFCEINITVTDCESKETFDTVPFEFKDGLGVAIPSNFAGGDYTVSISCADDEAGLTVNGNSRTQELTVENGKAYQIELVKGNGNLEKTSTITFFETTLAAVFVDTASGTMDNVNNSEDHSVKESGTIKVVNANGETEYDGGMEWIEGRGNSTWSAEKKPYNIKLEKKAEILGLNKAKKFCLLADYFDKSNIRNAFAFEITKALNVKYAVNYSFTNVYLNGEYNGLYLITDKIDIGDASVDIANLEKETKRLNPNIDDLTICSYGEDGKNNYYKGIPYLKNPQDITGGYLFETALLDYGRFEAESSGFISNEGQAMVFKSPKRLTQEQAQYIKACYQDFEDALFGENGVNAKTGKHYSEYIDVESFAKWYLIKEFAGDTDAGRFSDFFYKDSDKNGGKIYAGPLWDFDLAFDSEYTQLSNCSPNCLFIEQSVLQGRGGQLIQQLSKDEAFKETVKAVFENELSPIIDSSEEYFESVYALIQNDSAADECRWRKNEQRQTFEEGFAWVKSFVNARNEFLKSLWIENEKYVSVEFNGPRGRAYVTLIKSGDSFSIPYTEDEKYTYKWYYAGSNTPFEDGTEITENTKLETRATPKTDLFNILVYIFENPWFSAGIYALICVVYISFSYVIIVMITKKSNKRENTVKNEGD